MFGFVSTSCVFVIIQDRMSQSQRSARSLPREFRNVRQSSFFCWTRRSRFNFLTQEKNIKLKWTKKTPHREIVVFFVVKLNFYNRLKVKFVKWGKFLLKLPEISFIFLQSGMETSRSLNFSTWIRKINKFSRWKKIKVYRRKKCN